MLYLTLLAVIVCNVLSIQAVPQFGSLFGGYGGYGNPEMYPNNIGALGSFLNPLWLSNNLVPNGLVQTQRGVFSTFNRGFFQPVINGTGELFNLLAGDGRFGNSNQQTTGAPTTINGQSTPVAPQGLVQQPAHQPIASLGLPLSFLLPQMPQVAQPTVQPLVTITSAPTAAVPLINQSITTAPPR